MRGIKATQNKNNNKTAQQTASPGFAVRARKAQTSSSSCSSHRPAASEAEVAVVFPAAPRPLARSTCRRGGGLAARSKLTEEARRVGGLLVALPVLSASRWNSRPNPDWRRFILTRYFRD